MKIVHDEHGYREGGGKVQFDPSFDFLLFRQDWNGAENVFFNLSEKEKVIEAIYSNEILINPNYSILYAKNEKLLQKSPDLGCYKTIWEK